MAYSPLHLFVCPAHVEIGYKMKVQAGGCRMQLRRFQALPSEAP